MSWGNEKWKSGYNEVVIRNGYVYRNRQKVGYVSGDELKIDGHKVTIHPYDKNVCVDHRAVGYRCGDGTYKVKSDGKYWRRVK